MLHIDTARWGETPEDVRRLATGAPHPRTRERFLALYEITQASCATRVAPRTHRHPQTVMGWVHRYNRNGPEALVYRRTGGRRPFVPGSPQLSRRPCVPPAAAAPPLAGTDPAPRWTLRHLVGGVREPFGGHCCRETIRAALHRLGFSGKKAKKLLGRADPEQRRAFLARLGRLLAGARRGRYLRVYWDEAHIHQDADLG